MMKKLFLTLSLVAAFISAVTCQCKAQYSSKRMVCYFANWSSSRPSPANMVPEDLDPCLCTHVLYSFVPMSNNALSPSSTDLDYFKRMAAWKSKNPNIKIVLSVGGWNEGSGNFNSICSSDSTRQAFFQSVIKYTRQYNLDGIDIDWEYPQISQKAAYVEFMKKGHNMFLAEAASNGKSKLLLTAATAPDSTRMAAYDLPALAPFFDFINPMTYDMHGSWDGNSAHHTPLYGPDGAATTLQNYIKAGFPPSKLNIGLAAYGRTQSVSGQYTREAGILAYYEICNAKTNYVFDNNLKAPSATVSGQKVFYDDSTSVSEKVSWALSQQIGGAFIWDASLDDFRGTFCSQGKSPLISTALNKLTGDTSMTTSSPTTTTTPKPISTTSTTTTKCQYNPGKFCIGGEYAIFEHPTDCAKYIECNECGENIMSCPPGQLFNPDMFSCDSSTNVKCTTQSTTISNPTTTITKISFVYCDGTEDIKSHPEDCSKYIICSPNSESVETCSDGQFFNPDFLSCDLKANVQCGNQIETTTPLPSTSTTTTSLPSTTTTTLPSTTTTTITEISFVYCDGTEDIKAHPEDCGKYIICSPNSESVETCSDGQFFNPDFLSCDLKANVQCGNQIETTTPLPSTSTTTAFSITDACVGKDSESQIPYPEDCSKFIVCGQTEPISCDPGYLFDPISLICQPPLIVKCEKPIAKTPKCVKGEKYQDIYNCSKFYECGDDLQFQVKSCDAGYEFDLAELFCDSEEKINCQPRTLNRQFCKPDETGIIPHPLDCSKYINCDNYQENIVSCPVGKLFDGSLISCMLEQFVQCN